MAKYHITSNGSPGLCKATNNCPLGGEHEHFNTIEDAQKYADNINEKENKSVKDSNSSKELSE